MKQLMEFCIICIVIPSIYGQPPGGDGTTNVPTGPVSSKCDAILGDVYLDDSTDNIGDTIIIEARNNATNYLYPYPAFKAYIVDNNGNNILFGKETPNYYGIGGFYQDFIIKSNTTILQRGEQVTLSLELWSGFFDIWQCVFNWNGNINIKNTGDTSTSSSPTETTTKSSSTETVTSSSTETAVSTTETSASSTVNSIIYCQSNDDSTSCGDNTCQCSDGARCEMNNGNYGCKEFQVPSIATKTYKVQLLISMIALFAMVLWMM